MKRMIEDSVLTDIADAIRKKNGTDTKYEDVEMAQAVRDISSPKEEQEKTIDITENGTYDVLPDENKALSKVSVNVDVADSYYDTFWDNYQNNGNRTDYMYGFRGATWNDNIFLPKYNMKVTSAREMFQNAHITDLKAILENAGIVLDFAGSSDMRYVFSGSAITHLGIISTASTPSSWASGLFQHCVKLESVEKLILSNSLTSYSSMFEHCNFLTDIIIEGVIKVTIDFKYSPLTVGSAKSIITHLANYAGTENEFAYKVSFHSSVWELLGAEGDTAPHGGSWKDYISTALGWLY